MSKPLLDLDQRVLDLIQQKQPITAADVAKLLPEVKVKEVNVAIYQKLQPKGLVVQNGQDGSKPLWWTPVGLSKHQIKQMSMEAMLEDTDGVMDKEDVERRAWVKDQIKSDELRRRILDLLAIHPRSWHYFNNVGLLAEEIAPILQELEENKLITREPGLLHCILCRSYCSVFSLVKKESKSSPKTDKKDVLENIADRIPDILRNHGAQSVESLADQVGHFDEDDVAMALEELKSRKLVVQREDKRWMVAPPNSNYGLSRIIDTLQNGGAMSLQELDEEFEDVNLDEIDTGLKKLELLGVVAQRDDKRYILAAPKQDRQSKFTEPNVAHRIIQVLRYNGPQTAQEIEDESEDFDTKDILVALYELESRKEITQLSDKRWMLVWPKGKPETKDDGSFEIDRKTLQRGVADAVDKMEIHQKRWAACMRTSNPTLASRIMDALASRPREIIGLTREIAVGKLDEVNKTCQELEKLGHIIHSSSTLLWSIVDKPAKVARIRGNFHHLVDDLYRQSMWHIRDPWSTGGISSRLRDDFHHLVDELCDLLS